MNFGELDEAPEVEEDVLTYASLPGFTMPSSEEYQDINHISTTPPPEVQAMETQQELIEQ